MKKQGATARQQYMSGQNGGGCSAMNGGVSGADGRSRLRFRRARSGGAVASFPFLRSRHFARILLLAAAAICAFAANARGGASEWLLFTVTSAAVFISCVLPYALAGTWTVLREQIEDTGYEDGGHMRIRLKIQSSRPMPFMWVSIREEIVNMNADRTSPITFRTVYIPWFTRTRTVTYTVTGLQRGELAFQPVRIAAGDLLSMTVRSFVVPCPGRVLVLPKAPEGEKVVSLPSALPGGEPQSNHSARIAAHQPLLAAVPVLQAGTGPDSRAYVPGDPLRRINWRSMARGLGMQTRIDQLELSGETIILLDASRAHGSDGRLFDASVGRAAMAVHYAVRMGRAVTLVCGGRWGNRLHVRSDDSAQLRRSLEELARLQADDVQPLSERLRGILVKLPRGADVICITSEGSGESEATMVTGAGAGAAENGISDGIIPDGYLDRVEAIKQAARLASVRGGVFHLWLGCEGSDPADGERIWRSKLQGVECRVSVLPIPMRYLQQPDVVEGGEGDGSVTVT